MATVSCSTFVCEDYAYYHRVSKELFPGCQMHLLANQGACSTTFAIQFTKDGSAYHRILQFREHSFDLDINLVAKAKSTYGVYVPTTKRHGIPSCQTEIEQGSSKSCYEMEVIPGVPFMSIAPAGPSLSQPELAQQMNLIHDFADFVSRAWPEPGTKQPACIGKVGSQIPQKLKLLSDHLPYRQHREVAQKVLEEFKFIAKLPVVVNHGDTIPGNLMCDPETGHLKGVVDWAEAEYLPFGVCLYGLELLLGRLTSLTRRDSVMGDRPFIYYDCAAALRVLFWQTLRSKIPALQQDDSLMKLVILAKRIGTLLWFGFAWDGGAIDRVVNTERDVEELVYLNAFLDDTHDHASLSQVLSLEPIEP